ncbi:hypothetical protein GLOIN_2v1788498 [Rhizophagus irregularis DAOM 181602=DAOM 197198]|nr:hypothetical protein GLOIN_2v1788498 [Rhizophagus irregularis DAOM 181602=DAOM 197198]
MDIKNILAEEIIVEYYTDGSLRSSILTSIDKQDPNLVYTKIGVAFCVNDESALSAQANLSLWPSSICSELIFIEYNLRKFIKTLMNTRVTAEWSILKSNRHEIPINWNVT